MDMDNDERTEGAQVAHDSKTPATGAVKKVTSYKRIRSGGKSLVVYVAEECRKLDIGYGDWVKVTIEPADPDDMD